MESGELLSFEEKLAGRRILVTGHTGFTGSWACLWMSAIGMEVSGFSLPPETVPSLYQAIGIESSIRSMIGEIADAEAVRKCVESVEPEIIVHLAAQPLVRRSYREPLATFRTNAMGTANVLESARLCGSVKAVVCITTDKVYENHEWEWPYRENDELGGHDPYSASKAAAEMIIRGYRRSFTGAGSRLSIATARGGNIVGGGDWSEDRLIPDFVRAAVGNGRIQVRYPDAVRPWQHVLALVDGYLTLAAGLLEDPAAHAREWNFGPAVEESFTVREVLGILSSTWRRPRIEYLDQPHTEARNLLLDSGLARRCLGWRSPWHARRSVEMAARWYRSYYEAPARARDLCEEQLREWREARMGEARAR